MSAREMVCHLHAVNGVGEVSDNGAIVAVALVTTALGDAIGVLGR